MPKTILHITDVLTVGGTEVLLAGTIPKLKGYNHVIVYLAGENQFQNEFKDFPVICLGHTGKLSILCSVKRLKKIIKEHRVDIVHAHLFTSSLIAKLSCPKNCKLVFTIHNLLSKDAFEVNKLSLYAEKLTNKKRFSVIGVTKTVLEDYNKYIRIKGKSYVLHNFVNDIYFSIPYNPPKNVLDEFKLIAVGNLRRQKNYENLLKAFTYLKNYPISLSVFGSGNLEEKLSQFIKDEKINVCLKGRVVDVAAVLPNYHAYIMASLFEGYGIAPMEAMAAGMPLLLSDIPVFKEVTGDKPLYFNPTNPKEIANTILKAYNNWAQLEKQSANNRKFALTRASKDVYMKKLESIYQSILNNN